MSESIYWVYMLRCANQCLYTGYTDNLKLRFVEHLKGTGAKYTRSFKPIAIAQSWEIKGTKAKAMRLERFIKTLSKVEKEELIRNPHSELILPLLA